MQLEKEHRLESRVLSPPDRWTIGVERNRVVMYVVLALIGGFAGGFAVSRYLTPVAPDPRPLPTTTREAATQAGASVVNESSPSNSEFHEVTKIVRADTIEVEGTGVVQMIGIETPDGKTPSEIYGAHGREALDFTEKSLLGRKVRLDFDPVNAANGNKSPAGQTLAYVYTQDGTLFNSDMIRQGHAFARVNEPFRLIDDFRNVEREAMQAMRGIWGFSGSGTAVASSRDLPPLLGAASKDEKARDERRGRISPLAPSELGPNVPAISGTAAGSEQTVFISSADKMYHKANCDYLAKKPQAISLSQAKAEGYASCSRCFASTVLKAR